MAAPEQPPHPTLLIPGPVEYSDAVLSSAAHYSESHVGPGFVATFGDTLTLLRSLFQTSNPASRPLLVSGSGTLGWDLVAANLTEPGERALVLHTGYFADSFADCFETYGVATTQLRADVGHRPSLEQVAEALRQERYKVVTVTHTDTSTGVLSDVAGVARVAREASPETLVVVDGVCSVGCEELRFDEWGLDAVITASQKAIGAPAGLSISMFSGRAMEAFERRTKPPGSYFASFKNWMPIMQNYEAKQPSYFATPSPQLVHALNTALRELLRVPEGAPDAHAVAQTVAARVARHREVSDRIKAHLEQKLRLRQLAVEPEYAAHGMTAMWLPDGVPGPDLLKRLSDRGVVFAGGLHKDVKAKYVRFGHMGVSVMDERRDDVDKALRALEESLAELGYKPGPRT